MAEIGFYHLTRQPLDAVLPRLLEKAHAAGHRILVRCVDADQMKRLDEALWTYDERSFLPHGSDYKALQPILLTTSEDERANDPDVLVTLAGLASVNFTQFARVLYLFEESDAAALAAARRDWSALKEREGVTRTYWQQDERGRWVRKQ
jgi:DNA polymerase-3 subunit chi